MFNLFSNRNFLTTTVCIWIGWVAFSSRFIDNSVCDIDIMYVNFYQDRTITFGYSKFFYVTKSFPLPHHSFAERIFSKECPRCFLREIECEWGFEDENGKFRKNYLHHWKAEEKIRRKCLSNNFLKYFLVP